MNSHNTKAEKVVTKEALEIEARDGSVRVLQLDLIKANDLTIADDINPGSDPYNSTGQHVIIEPKIYLED